VTIADDTGDLLLRFMNFYGSQVKQLAEGTRVRARGEVKHGFFGAEMVHPTYKVVNEGAPLPTSLTPGVSVRRRPVADDPAARDRRRDEARRLDDTVPPRCAKSCRCRVRAGRAPAALPAADVDENALIEKSHPAWCA
jgi:ATP-dependent DNA helicase RecG